MNRKEAKKWGKLLLAFGEGKQIEILMWNGRWAPLHYWEELIVSPFLTYRVAGEKEDS